MSLTAVVSVDGKRDRLSQNENKPQKLLVIRQSYVIRCYIS